MNKYYYAFWTIITIMLWFSLGMLAYIVLTSQNGKGIEWIFDR